MSSRIKKLVLTVLMLSVVLGTVSIAAVEVYEKQLTATFGKIKFELDGVDVTANIESKYGTPAFIAEGRSYAPVRAIADLLDVEVEWDANTNTAVLTDRKVVGYKKEIEDLKKEIEKLKNPSSTKEETKPTKEETKPSTGSNLSRAELEKSLNSNYGTYNGVNLSIKLRESTNRIDADITANLKTAGQASAWNSLTNTEKRTLAEEIAKTIAKNNGNLNVYGTIVDTNANYTILSFDKLKANSSVSVSYDNKYYETNNYNSNYYSGYNRHADNIVASEFSNKGIQNARISNISSGERLTTYRIDLPSSYEYEWTRLDNSTITSMLDKVSNSIGNYYYNNNDYYYNNDYYNNYYNPYYPGHPLYEEYYNNYYYNNNYYNPNYNYGRYYDAEIRADIYMGSVKLGTYTRTFGGTYGTFK